MTAVADRVTIARRLAEVRQRIETVAGGRSVTIVGVTKAFGSGLWTEATAAGLSDLGENYAQELEAKIDELGWAAEPGPHRPRLHFIGGLQRNKIKRLVSVVDLWQTIDRIELIDSLASRAPGAAILVQVNTTDEDQKSGCRPDEVDALVARGVDAGLEVRGLMTIGPTDTAADPRPAFARLRSAVDRLGLTEASMGMSGDYEPAVAEGATMVRLGSVLFGARSPSGPTSPTPAVGPSRPAPPRRSRVGGGEGVT